MKTMTLEEYTRVFGIPNEEEVIPQQQEEGLPEVGVLHVHDGTDVSPVPAGTEVTIWYDYKGERGCSQGTVDPYNPDKDWKYVEFFLVHEYPTVDEPEAEEDYDGSWETICSLRIDGREAIVEYCKGYEDLHVHWVDEGGV